MKDFSKLNDSKNYCFENLLYDAIQEWNDSGNLFDEFKLPVLLEGQSGTTGKLFKNRRLPFFQSFVLYYIHKWFHFYTDSIIPWTWYKQLKIKHQ